MSNVIRAPRSTLDATVPATEAVVTIASEAAVPLAANDIETSAAKVDGHLNPNETISFENVLVHDKASEELGANSEESAENAAQDTEPNSEIVSNVDGSSSYVVSIISSGFVVGAGADVGMSMCATNDTVVAADEMGIASTSATAHQRHEKRLQLAAAEKPNDFNSSGQVPATDREREEDGNRLPSAGADDVTRAPGGSSCSGHVSAIASAHQIYNLSHGEEAAHESGEIGVFDKTEAKMDLSNYRFDRSGGRDGICRCRQ